MDLWKRYLAQQYVEEDQVKNSLRGVLRWRGKTLF